MTTEMARKCPGCGVPDDQWQGNHGQGVAAGDGVKYCCQDCAKGRACQCGR